MFTIIKRTLVLTILVVLVPIGAIAQQLADGEATPETQMVYRILCEQQGKATITGIAARVDWNTDEAQHVLDWTGRLPAINSYDFINLHASRDVNPNGWLDYSDMTVIDGWWNGGGLVSCMWHWQVKANNGTNMTCSPGSKPEETSFDVRNIFYTSSPGYQQMIHDIDQTAGYLKQMQTLGIPVLWRPLHEASGNICQYDGGKAWFWWGDKGAEAYKALWRFMYDRMTNHHGLHNLIWVWTSQTGDDDWYPGSDVVDIIARDNYGGDAATLADEHRQLSEQYPDKIIALGECGRWEQTPCATFSQQWDKGCRWSWATTWYDYDYINGSSQHYHADKTWWMDFITHPNAIDRELMYELMLDAGMNVTNRLSIMDIMPNAGWNSYYDAGQNTFCYTSDWGACGWNVNKEMSEYNKLVIQFAEPPATRGTIEGDGIVNTVIIPGISRYIMSLDEKYAGTILIKSESSNSKYKIKDAYFAKVEYSKPTTVVDVISIPTVQDGTHDMLGRRIADDSKGLVIRNQKKMFIK